MFIDVFEPVRFHQASLRCRRDGRRKYGPPPFPAKPVLLRVKFRALRVSVRAKRGTKGRRLVLGRRT
ncbi:hypothetical protein GCM10017673_08830 [Streptosporangium violaceochromogenes]|nr:hypothetical protein GCM10017673_08830 [Streptosporangium violaceochromogenes]